MINKTWTKLFVELFVYLALYQNVIMDGIVKIFTGMCILHNCVLAFTIYRPVLLHIILKICVMAASGQMGDNNLESISPVGAGFSPNGGLSRFSTTNI